MLVVRCDTSSHQGADPTNALVAQFLQILPDSYMSAGGRVHTARPLLEAAMSMILPADVPSASPDILKAVRATSFVALTNAEPPLDFYLDYGDIMGELNRPTYGGRGTVPTHFQQAFRLALS